MKKRGQLLGQPFVMVFAMIVGGLILIWGVYQIKSLGEIGGKTKLMKEVSDFQENIDAFYVLETGNSKKIRIRLPSKISNICFMYDHSKWKPDEKSENNPPNLYSYKTLLQANTDKHMFFFPVTAYKGLASVKVSHLRPKDYDPLCIKNGQEVRITSKGEYVEISIP